MLTLSDLNNAVIDSQFFKSIKLFKNNHFKELEYLLLVILFHAF